MKKPLNLPGFAPEVVRKVQDVMPDWDETMKLYRNRGLHEGKLKPALAEAYANDMTGAYFEGFAYLLERVRESFDKKDPGMISMTRDDTLHKAALILDNMAEKHKFRNPVETAIFLIEATAAFADGYEEGMKGAVEILRVLKVSKQH